jgi:hypothetical protein
MYKVLDKQCNKLPNGWVLNDTEINRKYKYVRCDNENLVKEN